MRVPKISMPLHLLLLFLLGLGTLQYGIVDHERISNLSRTVYREVRQLEKVFARNKQPPPVLPISYTPSKEEYVKDIARKYNTSPLAILEENDLSSPVISPNQTIIVPDVKDARRLKPDTWSKVYGNLYDGKPVTIDDVMIERFGLEYPEDVALVTDAKGVHSTLIVSGKGKTSTESMSFNNRRSHAELGALDLTCDGTQEIIAIHDFVDPSTPIPYSASMRLSAFYRDKEGRYWKIPLSESGHKVVTEDVDGNCFTDIISSDIGPYSMTFPSALSIKLWAKDGSNWVYFEPSVPEFRRVEWQHDDRAYSGGSFVERSNIPTNIKIARTMEFIANSPTYSSIQRLIDEGYIRSASHLEEALKLSERALVYKVGTGVFREASAMLDRFNNGKEEILTALVSNPTEAVRITGMILGTNDSHIITAAIDLATQNLWVVDTRTSSTQPFLSYIAQVTKENNGYGVKVGVEPLAAYALANYLGVGNVPLPWADGQPLAVVLAKNIAVQPDNSYVTFKLERDEEGNMKLSGGFETGQRLSKISSGLQAYASNNEPSIRERMKELMQNAVVNNLGLKGKACELMPIFCR